jgi:hypothetical protein
MEPLHTRLLTLRLAPEGSDAWAVEGRVLDLRRRGAVAIAALVNGPGVVHDMRLRLVVDRASLTVREADLTMPSVPFPPEAQAGGETCRENESGFAAVVGLSLRRGFASGLQRAIGGPRGCFHVFTLMRLIAATVTGALARGLEREDGRAFERAVFIDGFRDGSGEPALALRGRLTDLSYAPGSRERIADQFEGQLDAGIQLPGLIVESLTGRHREGGAGPWTSEGLGSLASLIGASLMRGYGLKLGEALEAQGPLAPLHALALMLQPVAFQCIPSLAEERAATGGVRAAGPGAALDSCFMWRRDGALITEVERRSHARAH